MPGIYTKQGKMPDIPEKIKDLYDKNKGNGLPMLSLRMNFLKGSTNVEHCRGNMEVEP